MGKIETYCQEDFLLHFFSHYITDPVDPDNRNCNSLFDLFLNKAEIVIDSAEKLTANFSNPLIKHFIKSSTSGKFDLIKYPDYFSNLKIDKTIIKDTNPTSLFFFGNHSYEEINEFGIFVSDTLNYLRNIHKVSVKPITFKVHPQKEFNEFTGWHCIREELPPRNSLIIADNYILDKEDQYDYNIFSLLSNILPDHSIAQDFHVSIITRKDLFKVERKQQKINDFLKGLDKPYNIKFGIFLTDTNKPHDRDIVSNYFRIKVGYSFDVYNHKGLPKKDTEINFIPINSEASPNTHFNLLKTLAFYTKNADCYGERKNRLLEYFR